MMSAIETKNIRKYWLSEKNAKNLIAMYSGPTQFKKERKTWKNGEIAVIYSVFARWEAETTANTMVFEGQVAKTL